MNGYTTLEDVYSLTDAESQCQFWVCNNTAHCPTMLNNRCMCSIFRRPVIPQSIGAFPSGASSCRYSLNGLKSYIIPGQECPICLESIQQKSNAYLTPCGHGFHKKCITHAYNIHTQNTDAAFNCPICRRCLGCDIEFIGERYNAKQGTLDALENFWFKYDYNTPVICCQTGDGNEASYHILGTHKNCDTCKNYREGV
jgi:hypothetical protein